MDNVYKNNKGHEYIIISDPCTKNKQRVVNIKFVNTDYVKEVRLSNAIKGNVVDDYAKEICGVACKGATPISKNRKAYSIWKNMIQRCYSKNNKSYRYYGEIGVYVSDSWLCYENFLRDLEFINGYDIDKFNNNEIQLDKDTLVENNNVYSLNTCSFISKLENIKSSHKVSRNRSKPTHIVKVINSDGNYIIINDIVSYAKENNLNKSKIYDCINGKAKSHKGLKFIKIGENKYE